MKIKIQFKIGRKYNVKIKGTAGEITKDNALRRWMLAGGLGHIN